MFSAFLSAYVLVVPTAIILLITNRGGLPRLCHSPQVAERDQREACALRHAVMAVFGTGGLQSIKSVL
jgi:hypothetical protein